MNERSTEDRPCVVAAVEAFHHGYMAVPIKAGGKSPHISAWPHVRWESEEQVREAFTRWADEGATNVGLLLGVASTGLIDVDMDHPKTVRLRDFFLPPTSMRTGRPGRPLSHYWYRVEDMDALPGTRRHKMPDGSVSVELRTNGSQTVIPPSVHPSGEKYRWEGRKWGGAKGPTVVDGRVLAVQVALLGLGCVLLENWPEQGGRHEAYLALAGGLLRFGNEGVHPYWERNLPVLIGALAQATNDEDGPDARVSEVMGTTLAKLRAGGKAIGFPRLAEFIGNEHSEQVRRMAREVESLAGFTAHPAERDTRAEVLEELEEHEIVMSTLPPEERDPLGERLGTWQPVDLEPYLAGEVHVPQPTVLRRSDGVGLFYEGRVNSLYGQSEAAKSWIALMACQQEMALGERVMYLDFEDEPTFTLARARALGVGDDDVRALFTYVRPEDPHADMQRNRFGGEQVTDIGRRNAELFLLALESMDPGLIIVDGMTVLYGLHGLDSNDAVSTDIITTWLKRLCRNGRSTVIVIDHTGKGAVRGSSPIGAHHKIAMVQGTAIQAHPIEQPMPGKRGEVQLIVYKDRPGAVRAVSSEQRPQVAAVVVLDSTEEGITRVEINPPDPDSVIIGDGEDGEAALARAAAKLEREAKRRAAEEAEARRREEREAARKEWEAAWARLREDVIGLFSGDLDATMSKGEMVAALTAMEGQEQDPDKMERNLKQMVSDLVDEGVLTQSGERRWTRYGLRSPN